MSLFSKLSGVQQQLVLTPHGALLLAAISMSAIDGDVDNNEIAIVERLDGGGSNDWNSALKAWKVMSTEECIEVVAHSMDSSQQLSTIANLIDIAMASGILTKAEQDLLDAYVAAFEVDEADVQKIVDVMALKNDRAKFMPN